MYPKTALNLAKTRSLETDLRDNFHQLAVTTNDDDELHTAIGSLYHHLYKYLAYVPVNVRTDEQKAKFLKQAFERSLRSTNYTHFKNQAFPYLKHVFSSHPYTRKFYNDNLKQEYQRMVLLQKLPTQIKRHAASFIL